MRNLLFLFIATISFFSCTKDDSDGKNDNESSTLTPYSCYHGAFKKAGSSSNIDTLFLFESNKAYYYVNGTKRDFEEYFINVSDESVGTNYFIYVEGSIDNAYGVDTFYFKCLDIVYSTISYALGSGRFSTGNNELNYTVCNKIE